MNPEYRVDADLKCANFVRYKEKKAKCSNNAWKCSNCFCESRERWNCPQCNTPKDRKKAESGFVCNVCGRWNYPYRHSCQCGVLRGEYSKVLRGSFGDNSVYDEQSNKRNKKIVSYLSVKKVVDVNVECMCTGEEVNEFLKKEQNNAQGILSRMNCEEFHCTAQSHVAEKSLQNLDKTFADCEKFMRMQRLTISQNTKDLKKAHLLIELLKVRLNSLTKK